MENELGLRLAGIALLLLAAFVAAVASVAIVFLSSHAYDAFVSADFLAFIVYLGLLTIAFMAVFVIVGFLLCLAVIFTLSED